VRRHTGMFTLAAAYSLYCVVALHAFSTTGPQVVPPGNSDTTAYLRMASLPVLSTDFFFGERAIGYALLLKAIDGNLAAAGYLQTALSLACWGFLAWASLSLFATTAGKGIGCSLVLLCAAREEVLFWNAVALSESLSLSLFALWIGSWIMFARGGRTFWRLFPLITSLPFAFARDSNAFLVLGAAILLAAACAFRLVGPRTLLLAAALAVFFAGSLACRLHSLRPEYSLQNIIGGRIIGDEWRFAALGKLGMPATLSEASKRQLAGKCGDQFVAFARTLFALGHSEVPELFYWLQERGQRDYRAFLARHPGYLLTEPFREDGLFRFAFPLASRIGPSGCDQPLRVEMPAGFRTLLPQPARELLQGDRRSWLLFLGALTAGACAAAWVRHRPFRGPFLWSLALLSACAPHLLVVWHGDALSVPRHAVLVGIQAHLALALALALACDSLVAAGAASGRARPGSQGFPGKISCSNASGVTGRENRYP